MSTSSPRNRAPTLHPALNASGNRARIHSLPLGFGQVFVRAQGLIPLVADENAPGCALTPLHSVFTVTETACAFLRHCHRCSGTLPIRAPARRLVCTLKAGFPEALPQLPMACFKPPSQTTAQKQTIRFSSSKTLASSGFIRFPFKLVEKNNTGQCEG